MNTINDIKRRGGRSSIMSKKSVAEYLVIPLVATLVSLAALNVLWTLFGY